MGFFEAAAAYKNLIIIGVLLAVFGSGLVYIKILKSEVATAQAEKKTVEAELGVSQASVKGLQDSIKNQNAAIDKLKADAAIRAAKNQVEIITAKKTAASYKQQADDLMKRPAPAGTVTGVARCDAVNQLINQEIKK